MCGSKNNHMLPYQDHCVLSSFTEETGRYLGCQLTFDPHRYRYSLDIDLVVQSFLTFIHLRFMEDGLPDSYSHASCFFPRNQCLHFQVHVVPQSAG